MTLLEIVNEFRCLNGVGRFYGHYPTENYYCLEHCLHMDRSGLCHAPAHLLNGKAEAVGMHGYIHSTEETLRRIIFGLFGNSEGHRNVLLMPNLAMECFVDKGMVYVTVRGW